MQSEKQSNSPIKKILQSISDASLVPFLAILTAVVLGGLIISFVGGDPFLAYKGLIQGSFGSTKALSETAVWATPDIFAGLAVALAFKCGLCDIVAEGHCAADALIVRRGFAPGRIVNFKANVGARGSDDADNYS